MKRRVDGSGAKFETIKVLTSYFDKSQRVKFFYVIISQIFLGLLDLLGVAVIGLIGSVTLNGIQSKPPGVSTTRVIDYIGLTEWTFQSQVLALGLLAAIVLSLRTCVSILLQRRFLFHLSRKGAELAELITAGLMRHSLLKLQKIGFALPVFAISTGSSLLTVTVIGGIISFLSDLILILILLLGLFFLNPFLSIQVLFFYGLLGLVLYYSVQKRVRELGLAESNVSIQVNKGVYESLVLHRELYVHGRREVYREKVTDLRNSLSEIQAKRALIPNVSKYVLESAVVIGSLLLCAIQFLAFDAVQAMTSLIVFLAMSSRIAPAVLRLHQNALQVNAGLGAGATTLELLDLMRFEELPSGNFSIESILGPSFKPKVEINKVSFSHEGNAEWSLNDISFEIEPGEFFAIVGPSASGKTTLVDIILGLIEPSAGKVRINSVPPKLAIERWPGLISYVPQDVNFIEGTILDNIALGYPSPDLESESLSHAIKASNLSDFINSLPKGVLSEIQERGVNLSGGLRQRIGIARALFTNPQLVIFDESTSALDSATERAVTETIHKLRGSRTVILIAHRLSTVVNADRVLYLSNGKISAIGSFHEVRTALPEFDHQAKLMGL